MPATDELPHVPAYGQSVWPEGYVLVWSSCVIGYASGTGGFVIWGPVKPR